MNNNNIPWVESPFFEELLTAKKLSGDKLRIVMEYHENGFVVVPGMLPQDLVNRVRRDTETNAFDPNFLIKTTRDENRVQDFWKVSSAAQELAAYPEILALLELLYEREAIPFQTLNFKAGSQQRAHSDTIHFSSLPARFMCGVWVALEDITEENGPVFYYPGSQRLTEYDFSDIRNTAETPSYDNYREYEDFIEHIVKINKLDKRKFLAKKGDLLIWSSNIIHGGSPVIKKGSTRWSQVTHYFFEGCYYYTPMLSNMVTNELYLRNKLINIKTGKPVESSYNGKKLNYVKTGYRLYTTTGKLKIPGIFGLFGRIKSRLTK